ncbi:uncharacterized protein [Channa argus]|uniref:uncharacterized protein n=1 Tax=Channa argus TaxID=215402 RepID=UPI00351FA4F4
MSIQSEEIVVGNEQGFGNDQDSDSEEDAVGQVDVQTQIIELAKKQQEVMSALSSLSTEPTRSYVYMPRERHIAPFSGDLDKDGRSVDEFIDEVERVLFTRNQSPPEQFDFVMSLLRGPALEEVRLRKDDQTEQTSDLFSYLREGFGDRRSSSQLLQNFYSCKERDGEDIRDFSHVLSQALSSVMKHYPRSVANGKIALRDQFIEGVRDPVLRRELRKYVRALPDSSLIEVREEAYSWSSEELGPGVKGGKSKVKACSHLTTDMQCRAVTTSENPCYLEVVMKALAEQGKVSASGQAEQSVSLDDVLKVLKEQVPTEVAQSFRKPSYFKQFGKREPLVAVSRAMQGPMIDSTKSELTREQVIERAIGKCPVVDVMLNKVATCCLLDTGSQVSTITDEFFRKHLLGDDDAMLATSSWLKLTAANGLEIPYQGYVELEVETMGLKIPNCGFLVLKASDGVTPAEHCIIGMNVIHKCRQLVVSEFDTVLEGTLDSGWRSAFQQIQTCIVERKIMARVLGRDKVRVPAESISTVMVKGHFSQIGTDTQLLIEPANAPLPPGVLVIPTLVDNKSRVLPVQVVNFSQEDIWLCPRTRIGIISPVECVENNQTCGVKFHRISADVEQVSVDMKNEQFDSKVQSVLEKLDIGGTEEERADLCALLARYTDVFADNDDDLGSTDKVKHEIKLVEDLPVTQPYRRIPPNQYKEVQEHISKLLKKGIIQESESSYASPVVIVQKSDGSIRLCVDYRKLNLKTVKDPFPLPRIDESFDALKGAKYFSTIDLASGYHQVVVDEQDRHKTAFTTLFGLFEYLRMPMAVCNGPATFQRLMQVTMNDLIFEMMLVYLDDILV